MTSSSHSEPSATLILLLSITVLHLRAAQQQRALIVQAHRDAHALDGLELQLRCGR